MFHSPTHGVVSIERMRSYILSFLAEQEEENYRIIVGTDSHAYAENGVDFVTAVVCHRKGHGGIYFWQRKVEKKQYVLRQRMYSEALLSLETAEMIISLFEKDGISKYNVEIHVDIGQIGDTRDLIAEIVGMIRGSGYEVKTKPDSFGASKVADRYT